MTKIETPSTFEGDKFLISILEGLYIEAIGCIEK